MANQDFNVLGNQRGKIGNLVGYVRKGKQCYRGYVAKVAQTKSEKALIVRARFGALGKMAMAMRGAINRGFLKLIKSSPMSGSNIFVKKNWDACVATEPEEVSIDYGAVSIADGNLAPVFFEAPSFEEESTVSVAFDGNNDAPGADPSDSVFLAAYQPDSNSAVVSKATSRSAGSISLVVPVRWSGMEVHVYGFVQNEADRWSEELLSTIPAYEASESTYIGHGTIA